MIKGKPTDVAFEVIVRHNKNIRIGIELIYGKITNFVSIKHGF
jgi:hypothetical protein